MPLKLMLSPHRNTINGGNGDDDDEDKAARRTSDLEKKDGRQWIESILINEMSVSSLDPPALISGIGRLKIGAGKYTTTIDW